MLVFVPFYMRLTVSAYHLLLIALIVRSVHLSKLFLDLLVSLLSYVTHPTFLVNCFYYTNNFSIHEKIITFINDNRRIFICRLGKKGNISVFCVGESFYVCQPVNDRKNVLTRAWIFTVP